MFLAFPPSLLLIRLLTGFFIPEVQFNFTMVCLIFDYYVYFFALQIKVFISGNFSSISFWVYLFYFFIFSFFFFRNNYVCVRIHLPVFLIYHWVIFLYWHSLSLNTWMVSSGWFFIALTIICILLCSFCCFWDDYFVFHPFPELLSPISLFFSLFFFFFFAIFCGLFNCFLFSSILSVSLLCLRMICISFQFSMVKLITHIYWTL